MLNVPEVIALSNSGQEPLESTGHRMLPKMQGRKLESQHTLFCPSYRKQSQPELGKKEEQTLDGLQHPGPQSSFPCCQKMLTAGTKNATCVLVYIQSVGGRVSPPPCYVLAPHFTLIPKDKARPFTEAVSSAHDGTIVISLLMLLKHCCVQVLLEIPFKMQILIQTVWPWTNSGVV